MNKAIVIGSINMDIVAFVKNHPKPGETIFGNKVEYFPGGKGSNQAVACKRLGCETLMIGQVGDDAFGEQLLSFQRQEGIDTKSVRRLHNAATGTAFITVADGGENHIIVIPGANAVWDEDFLSAVQITADDIVLAQFEVPDPVIAKVFKKAKNCGAMTLLNPAPVRTIPSDIRELADLIVVNEHELAHLTGIAVNIDDDTSVFAAAEQLANNHEQSIVVTLGDKGVRLLNKAQRHSIPARPVCAVDSTGAGDTFIGGLAAGLLSGLGLLKAAEFGNIAASISVTRPGAASSIPTLNEVNQLFRANY